MLSEFEERLAEVLGSRLPAPFAGNVQAPPAPSASNNPTVLVGVQQAEALEPEFGSQRPEIAPGSDDPRRVLRLKCTVGIEVTPAKNEGRGQQLQGLEVALYALDAPDFQDGSALLEPGDPGFLIQEMRILDAQAPLDPQAAGALPVGLKISAEGWFWPVGEVGAAGVQIGEVRVRGALLPLEILPAAPPLVAGGAPVELSFRLRTVGPLRVDGQDAPLPPLPFGSLALLLLGPGGGPGAGSLTGGTAGVGDVQLAELTNGSATLTYAPPAGPATDQLVVGLDDGEDGMGVEIGRLPLNVREA